VIKTFIDYEAYFRIVVHYVTDLEQLLLKDEQEACQSGLGAMDALHVAAAILAGATELITTKSPTSRFIELEISR
jgi:hypothetical protein